MNLRVSFGFGEILGSRSRHNHLHWSFDDFSSREHRDQHADCRGSDCERVEEKAMHCAISFRDVSGAGSDADFLLLNFCESPDWENSWKRRGRRMDFRDDAAFFDHHHRHHDDRPLVPGVVEVTRVAAFCAKTRPFCAKTRPLFLSILLVGFGRDECERTSRL